MTLRPTLLLLILLAGTAAAAPPGTGASDASPWSGWSSLRFRARAAAVFGGHVSFLLEHGERRRHLHTESRAKFFGATINRSRTETVWDRETGMPREAWSYGKKHGRHYTFDDDGYTVRKLAPEDDGWTVAVESRFDFEPPDDSKLAALYDYYGLLVDLKLTGLRAEGDTATVWVATSKGPRAFRITVSESRSNTRRIGDRRLALRELRLRFEPVGDDADEGFLDMEGETEVWVEATSLTPVEISGKVPRVPGRVRLVLVEID